MADRIKKRVGSPRVNEQMQVMVSKEAISTPALQGLVRLYHNSHVRILTEVPQDPAPEPNAVKSEFEIIVREQIRQGHPPETIYSLIRDVPDPKIKEKLFVRLMKHVFSYQKVPQDGKCLYHAIWLIFPTIFSTPEDVIEQIAAYMKGHADEFQKSLCSDDVKAIQGVEFAEVYAENVRSGTLWGGELELKALASLLKELGINRPIWVYHHDIELTFPQGDVDPGYRKYGEGSDPIRLLMSHEHYGVLLPRVVGKKRSTPVSENHQ